ncbi:Histone H1 [Eumeta japonica]|uniref:Histone H1 n=1 Tax=Eumeta variegata TaxID=151549 RepID=A0A4C1ZXG6_EUMVA|nr:Histone H1 [Eumeta japonica]
MADTAVASEAPAPTTRRRGEETEGYRGRWRRRCRQEAEGETDASEDFRDGQQRDQGAEGAQRFFSAGHQEIYRRPIQGRRREACAFIRKYLKSAVESGTLIQTKGKGASGSFKLESKSSSGSKKSSGGGGGGGGSGGVAVGASGAKRAGSKSASSAASSRAGGGGKKAPPPRSLFRAAAGKRKARPPRPVLRRRNLKRRPQREGRRRRRGRSGCRLRRREEEARRLRRGEGEGGQSEGRRSAEGEEDRQTAD